MVDWRAPVGCMCQLDFSNPVQENAIDRFFVGPLYKASISLELI